MNSEPQFLLESLSRWDFGWRLSQTDGRILLPVPQDFHSSVEAMHLLKRLSADVGSTILVTIAPDRTDDPHAEERIIEISQSGASTIASTAGH